jgi:oligopeptidase B
VLETKETTEVRYLRADRPAETPVVLRERKEGVRCLVAHHGDDFLVVDTDDAPDGRLLQVPITDPTAAVEIVPHVPGRKIDDLDAFARHFVVWGRRDGLTTATVHPDGADPYDLSFQESVYRVTADVNLEYDTAVLRFRYQSLVTPPTVYDQDLATGDRILRKQVPVLGGYDPEAYATTREWATAGDGTRIPISLVMRRDTAHDGTAPLLLYGYGSYEHSVDPGFSAARLSLLDRGVVYAIAHVRGGGEMGRGWYERGKMAHKANTFTDFVACAEHLVAAGYTSPDRLAARGASAGGLLIGAVLNLRPDLFRVLIAEVPFVDVINTMLDESLPLTITEWEEWGNPNLADQYEWMAAYAPYENLEQGDRPAMLVTAGLNDPRVAYWEPAKWVARLRTTPGGDRPLLLKTEMGAGHSGPSGRYDAWRDEAFVMAFLLRELGVETGS